MRLGVRLRTQRTSRPVYVSRIPAKTKQPHHAQPTECFVCGLPIWPGDEVLSRGYDIRVSCAGCPWPAEAIAQKTM